MLQWTRCVPMQLLDLFTIPHTVTLQGTMKSASWISWLQQSDNRQATLADCLTDVDAVINTDPIRHETCNLAGGGFRLIVEISADPKSGYQMGYPSISTS